MASIFIFLQLIIFDAVIINKFFQGKPFGPILVDETIWTLEDKKILEISLTKANLNKGEAWTALFKDDLGQRSFIPDPETLHQMRTKIDLEMFQIEARLQNPEKKKVLRLNLREFNFLLLFFAESRYGFQSGEAQSEIRSEI